VVLLRVVTVMVMSMMTTMVGVMLTAMMAGDVGDEWCC
jgi:hypothetical protein